MYLRVAAFLVALVPLVLPARAAEDSPARWKLENPFCDVLAEVAPLAGGSGYGLALFTRNGTTVQAHVTLVSDTDAYDAHVPDSNLFGGAYDRQAGPFVIKLPVSAKIEYYFVDSYALDGAQAAVCPSYVFPVAAAAVQTPPTAATAVTPTHLQALGKLACGQTYQPVATRRDAGGIIGHFGNKPVSVELRVYVDSRGRALDEQIVESSGILGVDSAALGNAQLQAFVPAQFLCTPVVGEISLRMDYVP
jgi:hypothetical protein